jgi:acyl-coenzyme A thioesterase PaaI-like protein
MTFELAPDGAVTSRVVVPDAFQGWRGVAHGGVVALLLDEAMAYAAGARGVIGVTGEMKMRFPPDRSDRCAARGAGQRALATAQRAGESRPA